jgi:glycosyltransferase involved in cell wall biosynthesis
MTKPFFSIITCTLNSDRFILKNIKSVESQTYKNYEHIVVDGASIDDTLKILKSYKKGHGEKVRLFTLSKLGVSAAFNKGIREARGEYLFFLNSDDYFYDNKVLKDVEEFLRINSELDWIYGKISVVEENGGRVGIFPNWKIFQISSNFILKFINFIPHQAVFMKRQVFKKYGNFDTTLMVNMDTDLWLRVAPITNWKFFDRIVSNYTLRRDSLSSSAKNKDLSIKTLEKVKARYLNPFELFFARIADRIIAVANKTYR